MYNGPAINSVCKIEKSAYDDGKIKFGLRNNFYSLEGNSLFQYHAIFQTTSGLLEIAGSPAIQIVAGVYHPEILGARRINRFMPVAWRRAAQKNVSVWGLAMPDL